MSDIKTGTSCHNDDSCGDYLQCVMVDEKTKTYKQCSGKMCGRQGDPKGVCYPFQKAGQVDVTNASKIAKKMCENLKGGAVCTRRRAQARRIVSLWSSQAQSRIWRFVLCRCR